MVLVNLKNTTGKYMLPYRDIPIPNYNIKLAIARLVDTYQEHVLSMIH